MSLPRSNTGGNAGVLLPMTLMITVAALAAGGVNANRETPLPWFEAWSERVEEKSAELGVRIAELPEAEQIVDDGIHFIFDARSTDYFEAGHLPMAMSLPETEFDEKFLEIAPMLIPEQEIMVYCSGADCDESLQVSKYLVEQGFTNVVLFESGYESWVEAGLPVEEGL